MRSPDTKTTVLLRRSQGGDERAIERLIGRQLPWIRDHVSARLGALLRTRAETGDYVHDVLVEFLRYGPAFTVTDGTHLRALLARIAENVLRGKVDWWTAKRRALSREVPLDTTLIRLGAHLGGDPAATTAHDEQQALIRLGLELLAPPARDVIVLRDFDRLDFRGVAGQLGVGEATARKRYQRAVEQLARIVAVLRRGEVPNLDSEEA